MTMTINAAESFEAMLKIIIYIVGFIQYNYLLLFNDFRVSKITKKPVINRLRRPTLVIPVIDQ